MHWEQGHEECLNKDQIFVCFLMLQKEQRFYLCITESQSKMTRNLKASLSLLSSNKLKWLLAVVSPANS